jgi:hypothetical protein
VVGDPSARVERERTAAKCAEPSRDAAERVPDNQTARETATVILEPPHEIVLCCWANPNRSGQLALHSKAVKSSLQLRVNVTISIVVSVGISISTFVPRMKELLMKLAINLICVMAGVTLAWRSGD